MTKQAARRNMLALLMVPAAFLLGLVLAVVVAGTASADSPLPTTSTSGTTTTSSTGFSAGGFDQNSPQAQFLVINGTVNATSDHEIVGSSAFPNFTTGAVDNYYSLARSYMDNSPFSEGTASPADTGPVGQTAAAGNTQQPQYADARWPGGPATANYGTRGQPFADAGAFEQLAKADASEASNGLSSPGLGGSKTLPVPKGFDKKLQQALAGWKSKYLGCPTVPKTSTSPLPTVPIPGVTVPTVKTPSTTTVTTPLGTVTTPSAPSVPKSVSTPSTRSLSTASTTCSTSSTSGSGSDGESLLESSSLAVLVPGTADKNKDINKVNTEKLETNPTTTATTTDTTQTTTTTDGSWTPKPYTLMMHGSSSVGRVSLGGGQIVIKGISVDASVENDGTATPTYKANVTVASASIGGIPVMIDQDGVHVASQHQALPYKQASDSLNGALKQAGIQIFLVAPQVTNCGQSASGTSTSTTTTTTTTDTTSTDQSGPCAQTGTIGGACSSTDTGTDTTSTSSSTTTTTSSTPTPPLPAGSGGTDTTSTAMPACPPPPTSCDTGTTSTGNSTTTGNTTTTGAAPATPTIGGSTTNSTTTTSSTSTTGTTSIGPSECPPPPTSCPGASTGTMPTTTTTATDTTATTGAPNPLGGAGATGGQQTIVMATGVHIVFTQPVSPSGVPAQFVEHILGEVFINSLATPAPPLPAVAPLGAPGSTSSSSCLGGGKHSKSSLSGGGGGGSSASSGSSGGGVPGSSSSGASSLSPTGSSYAASSQQPGSGGSSQSLPAVFARALHKPLWLLLAYLVWQLLVIGTGWSLWNWRRGGEPT